MDARRRGGGGSQEQRPLVTKRRWIFSGKFGFENIQGFAFMNNTDGALHNFMNMAFVTLGLEGFEGNNVGVDNGRFEVSTTILAIVYSDLVSNTGRDKIRQRFPRPNLRRQRVLDAPSNVACTAQQQQFNGNDSSGHSLMQVMMSATSWSGCTPNDTGSTEMHVPYTSGTNPLLYHGQDALIMQIKPAAILDFKGCCNVEACR